MNDYITYSDYLRVFSPGHEDTINPLIERYLDFSDIEEETEEEVLQNQRDEFNGGKPLKHSFIKNKPTSEALDRREHLYDSIDLF